MIIFELCGPIVSLIPTKQNLNESKRHHQDWEATERCHWHCCWCLLKVPCLHVFAHQPGSFPGTLPSKASPPISIDSSYMHILRELRTNWKLKEMKGNNPLMYFILLRRHYISVPYFNRKTIWGKGLHLIFTLHPQWRSAGLFALQLPIDTYWLTLNSLFRLHCSIFKFIYQSQQVAKSETIKMITFAQLSNRKSGKSATEVQLCLFNMQRKTYKLTNSSSYLKAPRY